MGPTILLIAHSERRDNRVAALLAARGCRLDWRCPKHGEALPRDLGGYAGAVVFGGPQSANDAPRTPYLQREIDWIGDVLAAGRPFLGICLGAQLMARALGAAVRPHPAGVLEAGYYPVVPTPEGRDLFPEPMHVYHWHREGFDLPPGAARLATGDSFANQAIRYGRAAYGLQFHPEVTPAIVRRWIGHEEAAADLRRPGAQPAEAHLAGCARHDPAIACWTGRFLDHWLALAAEVLPRPGRARAAAPASALCGRTLLS